MQTNRVYVVLAFAAAICAAVICAAGCGGSGSTPPPVNPTTYALNVTVSGTGSVSSSPAGISCGTDCSETSASGALVILTATAGNGYHLNTWGGVCSGSNATCTLTMSSALSVSASFVQNSPAPDTQAPTAPVNLVAQAASATQVNLTWNASTDNVSVHHYTLFRGGEAITSTTTLQYSDTVSASTTYSYTVKAVDAAGNTSTASNTATATTPAQSARGCPLPAYPNASCTGVPSGTTLTVFNGNMHIDVAGTVVDGLDIRGCVNVTAPRVVIRNSKISCANATPNAIYSGDGVYPYSSAGNGLLIEDSEIDCLNTSGTAIGDTNFSARRLNIHGCENGFDVDQYVTIEDSYIHDMYNSAVAHTDGIQLAGHYQLDASGNPVRDSRGDPVIVQGALNVIISHNTIYSRGVDGSDGTSAIISNRGGDTNILIKDNLMAGGAYTLYCEQGATGINFRVINNHFSTIFHSTVGTYGISTDCSDETQSGNVIHETNQPITLP